jgi:diguanylate cyclase
MHAGIESCRRHWLLTPECVSAMARPGIRWKEAQDQRSVRFRTDAIPSRCDLRVARGIPCENSRKSQMHLQAIDEVRPAPAACGSRRGPGHRAAQDTSTRFLRQKPGEPVCIAIQDIDTLLEAVGTRLRSTVGPGTGPGGASATSTELVECFESLNQLHTAITQQRLDHIELHRSTADLESRLSEVLAELADTQASQARTQHRALHDDLTSLPNRRYFRQQLDRALRSAAHATPALAVMYLDLDGMKSVNDTHGHSIGDQLLCVVGSRLVRTLRSTDVVSRIGGDEFALLLSDLPSAEDVAVWASRLCAAVSAPVQLGALRLRVQASIGIAMCPEHGQGASALVQNADRAMYHAKRHRSGHAFYDSAAKV